MTETRRPAHNSTYPKVVASWSNQALCYYLSFCLVDSEVLRNQHLRVGAKRYPFLNQLYYFHLLVNTSKNLPYSSLQQAHCYRENNFVTL